MKAIDKTLTQLSDIFEKLILTRPKRNALIGLPTISKNQIGEICCRVDEIVLASSDGAKVKPAIWSRFKNHFRINRYKELKADRYDEALAYLEKLCEEYANGVKMVKGISKPSLSSATRTWHN